MTVRIDPLTVPPGTVCSVPIHVQDASDLGALMVDVRYGTLVLKYQQTDIGTLAPNAIIETRELKPGLVAIGVIDKKGITGSGTLCTLRFQVLGGETDASLINPSVVEALGSNGKAVAADAKGGTLIVSSQPATPQHEGGGPTPTTPLGLESILFAIGIAFIVAGRR
jgi:hypothetical protein